MHKITFRSLELNDIETVKKFTDQWIGLNYFSKLELEVIYKKSQQRGLNSSFLAWDGEDLVGIRLTLAPGWSGSGQQKTFSERWTVNPLTVGYFKSLFVHPNYWRRGYGKELSRLSQQILKEQGATAIVTHSWFESPGQSSQALLLKMGFTEVGRHLKYWEAIDYLCNLCKPLRCRCTAIEMIKYI